MSYHENNFVIQTKLGIFIAAFVSGTVQYLNCN